MLGDWDVDEEPRSNQGLVNCWILVASRGCAAPPGTPWELWRGICAPQPPLTSPPAIPCQSRARVGLFKFCFGVRDVWADNIFLFSSAGSQFDEELGLGSDGRTGSLGTALAIISQWLCKVVHPQWKHPNFSISAGKNKLN